MREETGVDDVYLEQLYTFSDIGRDPRTWVMSCSYMALISSDKLELQAGDDAADASWFKVSYRQLREQKELMEDGYVKTLEYELKLSGEEELSAVVARTLTVKTTSTSTEYKIVSNNGLAFDHAKIIACAIERLRGKVNYTDIALHLMPKLLP